MVATVPPGTVPGERDTYATSSAGPVARTGATRATPTRPAAVTGSETIRLLSGCGGPIGLSAQPPSELSAVTRARAIVGATPGPGIVIELRLARDLDPRRDGVFSRRAVAERA